MPTKLNQVIAIEKGVKSTSAQEIAQAQQVLQKAQMLSGISRVYQSKDEEGEQFPPEFARVQVSTETVLRDVAKTLTKLFDITAIKDWANTEAAADIVVDGKALVTGVPATYLLFLEKQFDELLAFIKKLPALDAAETWTFDTASDCYVTELVQTVKTKKIPRNHVKAEATEKHPAQVEVYYEDVVVGHWKTLKFSGALSATRIKEIAVRVEKLQQSVKYAREEANAKETVDKKIGDALFGYLLAV